MGSYAAAVIAAAVLAAMSAGANRTLRPEKELPMQWGLDGKPTWWLPRRLALAFTPLLGSAVLLAVAAKTSAAAGVSWTTLGVAAAFVFAHGFAFAVDTQDAAAVGTPS